MCPPAVRWNSAESTHGKELRQLTVSRSWISPPVLSIDFVLRLAKVFARTTALAEHLERTPMGASASREDSHGPLFRSLSLGTFHFQDRFNRLIDVFESPGALTFLETKILSRFLA
jgi:hypothetical protein